MSVFCPRKAKAEAAFRDAIGADTIDDDGDWIAIRGYEINYADWADLQDHPERKPRSL